MVKARTQVTAQESTAPAKQSSLNHDMLEAPIAPNHHECGREIGVSGANRKMAPAIGFKPGGGQKSDPFAEAGFMSASTSCGHSDAVARGRNVPILLQKSQNTRRRFFRKKRS